MGHLGTHTEPQADCSWTPTSYTSVLVLLGSRRCPEHAPGGAKTRLGNLCAIWKHSAIGPSSHRFGPLDRPRCGRPTSSRRLRCCVSSDLRCLVSFTQM